MKKKIIQKQTQKRRPLRKQRLFFFLVESILYNNIDNRGTYIILSDTNHATTENHVVPKFSFHIDVQAAYNSLCAALAEWSGRALQLFQGRNALCPGAALVRAYSPTEGALVVVAVVVSAARHAHLSRVGNSVVYPVPT